MKKIEQLLETEEYVHIPYSEKECLEYKIAYAVKEEIRNHKWNQGTQGNVMSWEDAMNDWMDNHYDSYVSWFKSHMWPKPQRTRMSRFPLGRSKNSDPSAPLHYKV